MGAKSRLIATLLAALMATACAAAPPYNPFKVSPDEFYGKIKAIALAPIAVERRIENPEPVRDTFESLISAKLREAGFATVPSREYAVIRAHATRRVGGYFDPVTGRRDESKFRAVREQILRGLRTDFNADAVLHPNIEVVTAQWNGMFAKWDGASESTGGGPRASGQVSALSLVVTIEDMQGVNLYVNRGGIQLLAKVLGAGYHPVPRKELFAKEERNIEAVNRALGALVRKPGSALTPWEGAWLARVAHLQHQKSHLGRFRTSRLTTQSTQPVQVRSKEVSVHLGSYPGDGEGDRPVEAPGTEIRLRSRRALPLRAAEPGRQRKVQLAARRLRANRLLRSLPKQAELVLADTPVHPEDQPIVGQRQVIDLIEIGHQGSEVPAELE